MTQEQTVIENSELKIPTTLKALLEALIFAAQEPITVSQLRSIFQNQNTRNDESKQLEIETIQQIVKDLNKEYDKVGRPYHIVQIADGYQFATLADYAGWIGKLYKEQGRRKLSQSGIETLSIISYKQPITKAEIEKIRGVNCEYVLKALLEKELVTVTGRADTVGRPLLYGTTREFLKHFGLKSIIDLPRPREIEEILGESQFETERRMLEAQADVEQIKKEKDDFKSRLPHIPKKRSELDEKDVKIVPHGNIHEIKIVQTEDPKTLEDAGQEKIVFDQTEMAEEKMISISEETEEKGKVQKFEKIEENNIQNIERFNAKQSIEMEEVQTKDESIVHTYRTDQKGLLDNSQHPKRWEVWKEKIKGFIKKLFD